MGIGDPVSSPTYVLQHVYERPKLVIEHWDLYRCNSAPEELLDPAPDNTIRLIEWPEKCPEVLQQCLYLLHFEYTFDSQTPLDRRVTMIGFEPEITERVQKTWHHP
jgi:tRNA A37 threonylcarbamoyladenosine biosynthesis protein TsaE